MTAIDPPPLLEVKNLEKYFPAGSLGLPWHERPMVKAVDGVDFTIWPGETLGLVGESGSGKTTLTKLILLLEQPTAGQILFEGRDLAELGGRDLLAYRQAVQCVFQDPYSSLSPRLRVGDIIAEPLEVQRPLSRQQVRARVGEALELVGLSPAQARLFPHEFSGGQRQRIAIARAIAASARLIVLDEPVSALDVSIRAQIMVLLEDLQRQLGVSYLFVGHDLATVTHISHRIAVMYLGRIVELGDSQQMCEKPLHPYTQALFAAALPALPSDNGKIAAPVSGEVPSALNLPRGCRFHPRCPSVMDRCRAEEPTLGEPAAGRAVACYLYEPAVSAGSTSSVVTR